MQQQTSISSELSAQLHRELEPNERLLWTGQPEKGRMNVGERVLATIFGIYSFCMLLGGVIGLTLGRSGAPGALFLGMGMLFGIISLAAALSSKKRATQTVYGVTNRRVVILQTGKQNRVESIFPQNLSEIVRVEKQDGTGDLQLGSRLSATQNGMMPSQPVLAGIPDVKRVEQLVREVFFATQPIATTARSAAEIAAENELDSAQWWTRNRG
jgi:hypothetical protein